MGGSARPARRAGPPARAVRHPSLLHARDRCAAAVRAALRLLAAGRAGRGGGERVLRGDGPAPSRDGGPSDGGEVRAARRTASRARGQARRAAAALLTNARYLGLRVVPEAEAAAKG